jgi:branched-chain amino acid transport system substrate-binding protein
MRRPLFLADRTMMNRIARSLRWMLTASPILALGLSGCGSSVPDVLKIGVAVPLSGPTAVRGQDLLNGALLAAEELNAKGVLIDGKSVKIEIVPKDDKNDVEAAKTVAQQLVDEKVHAVIGHVYTSQTKAALPIYASKGIPNLFTSTTQGLLEIGAGNAFRLSAHDGIQARAVAGFTRENLRATRVVALVESSDYGKGMYDGVVGAAADKGNPPLKIDLQVGELVTDQQAADIVAAKPNVVLALVPREAQTVSLMNKLKALGYTDYVIVGLNGTKTPSFAKVDTSGTKGVYVTATTIDFTESNAGREFMARFNARFNANPVWGAHYAYDAVYVLADTVRRAKSANAAELVAGLKKFETNAPVNRQMRFADSGEQRFPDVGVYKTEGGTWVPQARTSSW